MTDPREIEALCAEAESPLVHRVQHFDALTGRTVHPHCVVCGHASGWPCASVRAATALRALVAENAELRAQRDRARADVNRWIKAAMIASMPDEFGLAFDPMSPEAWGESRRRVFAGVLDERDALAAQLAAARADSERLDWLDRVLQAGLEGEVAERMTRVWDGDLRSFIDKASVVGYAAIDAAKGGV